MPCHRTHAIEPGVCLTRDPLPRLTDEQYMEAQTKRIDQLERERDEAIAKLDFLKSKGLTVGLLKTSDKPEPYLAYAIEPDSELCNLKIVNAMIDAERERDEARANLTYWRGVVRGARSELHQAGRISDDEYADLACDTTARNIVEKIDALTRERDEARKERDALHEVVQQALTPLAVLTVCLKDDTIQLGPELRAQIVSAHDAVVKRLAGATE